MHVGLKWKYQQSALFITPHHPLLHPLPPYPPTPLHQPVLSTDPLGPASSLIWPIERALSRPLIPQRRLSFPCRIYVLIRIFQGNDTSVNRRNIRLFILLSWVFQMYLDVLSNSLSNWWYSLSNWWSATSPECFGRILCNVWPKVEISWKSFCGIFRNVAKGHMGLW